jgi:hypothetical protein
LLNCSRTLVPETQNHPYLRQVLVYDFNRRLKKRPRCILTARLTQP